jgi:hypothetical protein
MSVPGLNKHDLLRYLVPSQVVQPFKLVKNNEMRALKHGENDQLESHTCTANYRRTRQLPQNRRAKTHTSVNGEIQFSASVCACVRSKDSDGRVAQLYTRLAFVTHKSLDGRRYCPLRLLPSGYGTRGGATAWRAKTKYDVISVSLQPSATVIDAVLTPTVHFMFSQMSISVA